MADLLEIKVKALKDKLEVLKAELTRLEKENSAGLLSPIERMRLESLNQEKRDIVLKIKELLM